MPTGEAPQYTSVLTLSHEMQTHPEVIESELDPVRMTLEGRTSRRISDEVVMATLFMRTATDYLRGITREEEHATGRTANFYPGGIRFSRGVDFNRLDDNEKRTVRLNYTALILGLAIQMMDEMVQRRQDLFFTGEFCDRYNLLIAGTGFPELTLAYFTPHTIPGIKLHATDDGPAEMVGTDIYVLREVYTKSGVLALFKQPQPYYKLPKSLRWFIERQGLIDYVPIILKELRKNMTLFETGRRSLRQQFASQLIQAANLDWFGRQLEGIDLDPNMPRRGED